MARIVEIVSATVALAASDGAQVALPALPVSAASGNSVSALLSKKSHEIAWSYRMVVRHVTVMTSATILFDLAEAVNQLVRELEDQLNEQVEFIIGMEEVAKSGRTLRNALQIEGNMHQKSSDPAFDDTRLAKAYNDMVIAFEHFNRHLQSLAVPTS